MTDSPDVPAEVAEVVPADVPTLPVVDVRSGMFGGSVGPDTSGYGGLVRTVELPAASVRPFGGWYDEVADELDLALADDGIGFDEAVIYTVVDRGEITFHVRPEHLLTFVRRLRDEPGLRFEVCTGVSGVHYPHMTGAELHAVWHFLSITHNRMVRVEVSASESHPHVPSIVSVYPADDWHERETFDMFGIVFDGFDDGSGLGLRPLLLPEGFEGTPLRKSFVLAARAVKPWPGAKEPGESDAHAAPSRRKTLPPGVPDPVAWGPRRPGEPAAEDGDGG